MLLSRTLSFGRETCAHFVGHGDLQEFTHSGLSRSETRVHGSLVGAQAKALCCYLGHSHSAEKRVRIFLAMETFKSSHTLVCRGPKQEFMAPLSGRRRKLGIS